MIGIVLRTVDVGIHLETAIDIDQGQTGLMGPRRTVESLDHTTDGQIGPVIDLKAAGKVSLTCQLRYLTQSLKAVEGSALIISHNGYSVLGDSQQIGPGKGSYTGLHGLLGMEIHGQAYIFLISFVQEIHVSAEKPVLVHDIYTARYIQHRTLRSYLHHMRNRVDLTVQDRLPYRVTAPQRSCHCHCCHKE